MARAPSKRSWERKARRLVRLKTSAYTTMDNTASIVILRVVFRLYRLFKMFYLGSP